MSEALKLVQNSFEAAEKAQGDHFERLLKYYESYRAEPNQENYNVVTRSQYVVPIIFKAVETILPRIISVLFSASPPVQARWRRHQPGQEGKLKNVDQLFEYLFDQEELFWPFVAWIKESLIYGQSYLKIGWKREIITETVSVPMLDGLEIKNVDMISQIGEETRGRIADHEVKRDRVVKDTVDVQNVDIFNMFFAPEAHFPFPFDTSKYVIQRNFRRKSDIMLLREQNTYGPKGGGEDFNEDDLPRSAQSHYGTEIPREMKANAINRNASVPDQNTDDDPLVDVYEYWENDKVITTAGHGVVLREEANPFRSKDRPLRKPYVAACDTLIAGELWQIGEAEPLFHTQVEMSTLRRMRTDNNNLIINKGILYNEDVNFDLESWKLSRPGMAVGVGAMDRPLRDVVQEINRGDINGASYKEFDQLDKDSQDISGLRDYAVGSAPERRETATTVQLLQAAANARFDIKVRNYNHSFVQAAYMMYERVMQFMTQPVPLRVPVEGTLETQFKRITRDDLPDLIDLDLTAPGSPQLLLKDARKQELMQMYQGLVGNPMAPPAAALQLYIIILKNSEVEGIEPIIALLEQAAGVQSNMPMQPQMGTEFAGNGSSAPQPPSTPNMNPQVNENPVALPNPSPEQ